MEMGHTAVPREEKYFFIHIQKTAGTSLRRHLLANFDWSQIYPTNDQEAGLSAFRLSYLSAEELLDCSPQEQEKFKLFLGHLPFAVAEHLSKNFTLKTFTLLRDPVERTISVLKQKKSKRAEFAKATLEEIYADDNIFKGQILNHQTKIFAIPPDFSHLAGFAHYKVGREELKVAKRNLKKVDVIGLQSDMHTFLIALNDRFGWQILDTGLQENIGHGMEISNTLIDKIRQDNSVDIEFYQFACRLVARRRALLRLRRAPSNLYRRLFRRDAGLWK